jgi:uncharacterized protein
MDRLFLDANVLFSAAYKSDARVHRLWRLPGILLCSSRYALQEAQINLAEDIQQERLVKLAGRCRFFEAPDRDLPRGIALPEKDAPILLAAVEARSDYLLTGDFRRFGPYFGKKIEGVMIVSPAQYLKLRNA